LRGKVGGAQFYHFAGADEQHVLFGNLVEDALRQAHGSGAMDTLCAPISVVLRTSLATEKLRWNSWCR
jgi:hypothetical protein